MNCRWMWGGGAPGTEDYSGDGDDTGGILAELLLIPLSDKKLF